MSSNTKEATTSSMVDVVLWVLAIGVVLGGVYANTLYVEVDFLIRLAAGVVLAGLAVGITLQTQQGRAGWELAKEARIEVRKVVWPTREETTQTTMIVAASVLVVSLILWGLDSGLSWGIKSLTSPNFSANEDSSIRSWSACITCFSKPEYACTTNQCLDTTVS